MSAQSWCKKLLTDRPTLERPCVEVHRRSTLMIWSLLLQQRPACLEKAWITIDWLSIVWKSDLSDKLKQDFFQAVAVSVPLHRCTTWTQTKRTEKRLDRNYTRMLRANLNMSWKHLRNETTAVRPRLIYIYIVRIV